MKPEVIVLVICIYITTIQLVLPKDSSPRIFKFDLSNTFSKKNSAKRNVAASINSLKDKLKSPLKNLIAVERLKRNNNANRLIRHDPHSQRRDHVDVWNQVLESLKVDKNTIARQKKNNKVDVIQRSFTNKNLRRDDNEDPSSSSKDSSSQEGDIEDLKEKVREEFRQKRLQTLDMTTPKGDFINMAAARPWGTNCGDEMQHDMPWGTCMLPMECEAEFRIYRGDKACGKTQFVCCALQINTYDNYVGFDVSFAGSSMESDGNDDSGSGKNSEERRRRKKRKDEKRRKEERKKRKKRIRKNIRSISRKIQRILSRMYKNTTAERKLRTKSLKAYIKMLKNKYKQDRKDVKAVHEDQLKKADNLLLQKLNQLLGMNEEFAKNATFRDILVNGTISAKAARMLSVMFPELAHSLRSYARRTGADLKDGDSSYDVEYGFLYY